MSKTLFCEESERYLIGSIFRDYRLYDDVAEVMPVDFYSAKHQDIWAAVQSIRAKHFSPDPVAVADILKQQSKLDEVGGLQYLQELKAEDYTTVKLGYHAKTIKRHAIQRKLIQVAEGIKREAENPADPDELLDVAEKLVLDVREHGTMTETKHISHFVKQVQESITARETQTSNGIPTGLAALDSIISFRPGQLIVIGARPGGGKSISGLQFAIHAADHGHTVGIYSLEMSGEELAARGLSLRGIDASFTTCKRTACDDEAERLAEVAAEVSNLPVFVNERAWSTIQAISADARRLRRKHNVKMIVVDYLQLIQSVRSKGMMRYEQLGEITRNLKHLAKELRIPIILLAQLNRDSEKAGANKTPELWHIKESGNAEQDADIVLLLWGNPTNHNKVNIKVAKNRHGLKDVVISVNHDKKYMRFSHDLDGGAF